MLAKPGSDAALPNYVYGRIRNKPLTVGNVTFEKGMVYFKDNKVIAVIEHKKTWMQIWAVGKINEQQTILTSYGCQFEDQMHEFVRNYL
jgi:hypothetical protein